MRFTRENRPAGIHRLQARQLCTPRRGREMRRWNRATATTSATTTTTGRGLIRAAAWRRGLKRPPRMLSRRCGCGHFRHTWPRKRDAGNAGLAASVPFRGPFSLISAWPSGKKGAVQRPTRKGNARCPYEIYISWSLVSPPHWISFPARIRRFTAQMN